MRLLIHYGILVATVTALVLFAPRFLPQIRLRASKKNAVVVGFVFATLNLALGWLLVLLLKILSLGILAILGFLATFTSNAILLYATDVLLRDFEIENLSSLLWLAGIITIANGILSIVLR